MSTWTANFAEHEFLRSTTAARLGIALGWTIPEHRANALRLTRRVLEPLRERVGRPVHITSGYRNDALTEALIDQGLSASRTSDHLTGRAADIVIRGMTHEEVATQLYHLGAEGRIEYDQLIWYEEGTGGSCHVSYRRGANRMQARVKRKGVRQLQPWMPTPAPFDDSPIGEMEGAELGAMHGGLLGWSVAL